MRAQRGDHAHERLNPNQQIPLTGQTVQDFWAWGFSDLLTNISRAVFAGWIVGSALDAVGGIRPVWAYYDLDYAGAKIEVKSMAHIRNWKRPERVQNSFDIKATGADFPVEEGADPGPDTQYYYDVEKKRRADVYVFAIYAERDPARLDPLNIEAWEFLEHTGARAALRLPGFGSLKSYRGGYPSRKICGLESSRG